MSVLMSNRVMVEAIRSATAIVKMGDVNFNVESPEDLELRKAARNLLFDLYFDASSKLDFERNWLKKVPEDKP